MGDICFACASTRESSVDETDLIQDVPFMNCHSSQLQFSQPLTVCYCC